MSVTIKEIASLANVSRGTVDKVLNNRPGVKEATREKVLKIANELHYQPNFIGKALVHINDPVKIGIILTPDYNTFVQEMLDGINKAKEEFALFGLEIITKIMTTLEPREQIEIINELVNEHVNGMAVFPTDSQIVINRLNQLAQNHIAIITFNSKVFGIHGLSFIGQDHTKGGRTAAELLSKILPDSSNIGVIISSNNLSCHQDRLHGFQYKLAETNRNFRILDIQENQDRKENAFKITLEYCNRFPNLDAIYLTGGGISGVCSALEIANRPKKIKVISHDLTPDTISLMKSGKIDFVLGQDPELQGYQLVKVMFEYFFKSITPPEEIKIPITIATGESL